MLFSSQPKIPNINSKELMALLKGSEPPFLLDVRTPAEFSQGHIHGAHLIPVTDLRARQAEVPTDQAIVTICHSGHRSMTAAKQLTEAGYRVTNLTGGMQDWIGPVERGN